MRIWRKTIAVAMYFAAAIFCLGGVTFDCDSGSPCVIYSVNCPSAVINFHYTSYDCYSSDYYVQGGQQGIGYAQFCPESYRKTVYEIDSVVCGVVTNYYNISANATNGDYELPFVETNGFVWNIQISGDTNQPPPGDGNSYTAKGSFTNNFLFDLNYEIKAGTNILKQGTLSPGESFSYDYSFTNYPGALSISRTPTFDSALASDYPGVFGEKTLEWTTNATATNLVMRAADPVPVRGSAPTIGSNLVYTALGSNGVVYTVSRYTNGAGKTFTNIARVYDSSSATIESEQTSSNLVNSALSSGQNKSSLMSNIVAQITYSDISVLNQLQFGPVDTNAFAFDINLWGGKSFKFTLPVLDPKMLSLYGFINKIFKICVVVSYYSLIVFLIYKFLVDSFSVPSFAMPHVSVMGFDFSALVYKGVFVLFMGFFVSILTYVSQNILSLSIGVLLSDFFAGMSGSFEFHQVWNLLNLVLPVPFAISYFISGLCFYVVMALGFVVLNTIKTALTAG